jgi:hypothetical protein
MLGTILELKGGVFILSFGVTHTEGAKQIPLVVEGDRLLQVVVGVSLWLRGLILMTLILVRG